MFFFKSSEFRLLWPFYFEVLFSSALFIAFAFLTLYYLGLGFSLFQVGILYSAYALAGIVFEIPTGAVADVYGRKFSVLLGSVLSALACALLFVFNDFFVVLLLIAFYGAAGTLVSGAIDAWIVDRLKQNRQPSLVAEYYVKSHSIAGLGCFISGILGAFLVLHFGLSVIWVMGVLVYSMAAVIFLFVHERFVRRADAGKGRVHEFVSHTDQSLRHAAAHPVLSRLIVLTFILAVLAAFVGDITLYPFMKELGMPVYAFGYFFSALFLLSTVAPFLVKPIAKLLGGYSKVLRFSFMLAGILLLGFYFTNSLIPAVLLAILFCTTWDLTYPAMNILLHKHAPNKFRATLGSTSSMFAGLGGALAFPLVGLVVDFIGPQDTLVLSSLIIIPAVIILAGIKEKQK